MAYIGKQPTVGNFVKLDAITTSATTTFNLTNGGVAYYPQSANHCIVSLNGVIQSPTTSFTISGSTIVFASALTSSDVIDFILVLGDVLNIGTPSDATVGFSKITSNLITGATAVTAPATDDVLLCYDTSATALRKITFANFGNAPAFMAFNNGSTTQSCASSTTVEVTNFTTEAFDTGNAFNTSTGRFTPQVAGKYFFTASIYMTNNPVAVGFSFINIVKNNSGSLNQINEVGFIDRNSLSTITVNGIIEMNGSTDFASVNFHQQSGTSQNIGGASGASLHFFGGYRLIGA